jgi:hypothetical protein
LLGLPLVAVFTSGVAGAEDKKPRLKEVDSAIAGTHTLRGVVEKLGTDTLVLVEVCEEGPAVEHHLTPVDRLREGDVLDDVWGMFAYRWKDMKRGDTIQVHAKVDKIDGILVTVHGLSGSA